MLHLQWVWSQCPRMCKQKKSTKEESFSEVLKSLSWERLSKNVCNLFFCPDIFQLHIIFCDLFPKKVKLDWNVLGLGVHNWIIGDTNGRKMISSTLTSMMSMLSLSCLMYKLLYSDSLDEANTARHRRNM